MDGAIVAAVGWGCAVAMDGARALDDSLQPAPRPVLYATGAILVWVCQAEARIERARAAGADWREQVSRAFGLGEG